MHAYIHKINIYVLHACIHTYIHILIQPHFFLDVLLIVCSGRGSLPAGGRLDERLRKLSECRGHG